MASAGVKKEMKAMMVSRGHGKGHALPDMAIAAKVSSANPHVRWQFVSYAAGAEAYRAFGYDVLDMKAADNPPMWDMVVAFTRLIADSPPDLVVSHEEIGIIPAAKAFHIPSLFITDFFADPIHPFTQALRHAERIIFTAQQGLFTEPPYLRGKVHYVGRAVREMKYEVSDRDRVRVELHMPIDAFLVLCQPGSWLDSQVPLAELLLAAWELLPIASKRLVWIAGREYEAITARVGERPDIIVRREDWNLDRLMAASNILITKANRMTVYEAAAMGLPSISMSTLLNWPDDVAITAVESNLALLSGDMTPEKFARLIVQKARTACDRASEVSGGVGKAAEVILSYFDAIHGKSEGQPENG